MGRGHATEWEASGTLSKRPIDLLCIDLLIGRGRRVVRAYSAPGEAVSFDGMGEYPRPNISRCARIEQVAFLDAMLRESWQPPVIDLHEPGVAGAVGVFANGLWVHVGFDFRDRP